jgi:5-methyltetrahydrofolate--homocysteine methyltransferase
LLPLRIAAERRTPIEWRAEDVAAAPFTGTRVVEPAIAEVRDVIDWTFFFAAWELKGSFPQILNHDRYGEQARELFADAQELLAEIEADGSLQIRGAYGLWPASSEGDDIVLGNGVTLPMLRQQADRGEEPNRSLADFVAPVETGLADHIGAFAVTAGLGVDDLVKRYEAEHDDYQAIIVKALADRLAEAFAEFLHQRARREWYAPDEHLSDEDLLKENFRGIRPAFGYPACPDHSEKGKLFELLQAERVGLSLTESYAMLPAAAVSGVYFHHPQAKYFAVGRIGRDQLEDYATRRNIPVSEAERWLGPSLG